MMLSRVADNLYWMSRYIERAENTARIIDVYLNMILDLPLGIQTKNQQINLLHSLELQIPEHQTADDFQKFINDLTFSETNSQSVFASIAAARENARQVREQISSEMWLHLNRFYLDLKQGKKGHDYAVEPHDFYMAVKLDSHLFQGVTDATMNHDQGWHFIQIGRYVERVINLVSVLNVYMQHPHQRDSHSIYSAYYFEMLTLLKSVTAWEAYCKTYNPDLDATLILEFLLFNAQFPHAAHFCVNQLAYSVSELSRVTRIQSNRLNRLVGRLQSMLSYDDVDEVFEGDFRTYLNNVRRQIYQINDMLYSTFITYSIDDALKK